MTKKRSPATNAGAYLLAWLAETPNEIDAAVLSTQDLAEKEARAEQVRDRWVDDERAWPLGGR